MEEICFRYSGRGAARAVADDLRQLHGGAPPPRLAGESGDVIHVPGELWARPLVPELTLGLGGRLVACEPLPDAGSWAEPSIARKEQEE